MKKVSSNTQSKSRSDDVPKLIKELAHSFGKRLDRIEKRFDVVENSIDTLAESTARGFEETGKRFDEVAENIEGLARSTAVGFEEQDRYQKENRESFEKMNTKLEKLAEGQTDIKLRVSSVESEVQGGFEDMEEILIEHERRINRLGDLATPFVHHR